ncbi:hypothetical protein NC653_030056 [Populus alba x Populus x berolinensis]|uniref:Translation initiation factor eIF2B subunit delta n=1 Tax=Populus alba x Populus x berolinensis TaxID=444605 RepID=A0AAD6M4N2_9ROSI|nr:hypothetical protein NC653_030056 [Populus alba x Populus x berolinensis]
MSLGNSIHVVIVDSHPKLEGQALLRRLVGKGLRCTYTHINAVSYIMHDVTRVFLAHPQYYLMELCIRGYDATPSEYVSMIITDYGMIPPTSVPVIVREYGREHLWIQ